MSHTSDMRTELVGERQGKQMHNTKKQQHKTAKESQILTMVASSKS